ncbi:MAG: MG2 domain protein [Bacteroidetes bacterium ADurb.Bin234]|nr:MAG: MG2 domain protein [Bacteroidetes bacterium ADurb.Bin234]
MIEQINFHYLKSLENKELLQKTKVEDFQILLKDADKSVSYRPMVFDMLAHEALAFFSEKRYSMSIPIEAFNLNNPEYMSDNEKFIRLKITSPDSLSLSYNSLKIMQELTAFHLQSGNTLALIDISLYRLKYIKENSTLENRDELYLKTLESFEKAYKGKAGYEDICYELGEYYEKRAATYHPETTPDYRWDYKTAIQWYEKAIAADSTSIAANNARAAMETIQQKRISLFCNNILIPHQKSFISYEYKNTNKIFCRIIPITENQYSKLTYGGKEIYQQLLNMTYTKQWSKDLVLESDYQTRQINDALDALSIGHYILLVSLNDFDNQDAEGYTYIYFNVSNINVMSRYNDDNTEILVFNRTTGEPFHNMEVTTYYEKYNSTMKYNQKVYKTNENGIVHIPYNNTYRQLVLEINNEQGSLKSKQYNNSYRNQNKHQTQERVYFFTDRAIYRPGQTVYFKGIVIKSGYKTNEILANKKVEVTIKNRNWEDVNKMTFTANEYGSFAGSFVLPLGELSGNYSINCLNSRHYISVEEYKRPQFEVLIDAPKDSYKLNEKVSINGSVLAYSGYPIDDATVKYRVVRKPSFPYWYWWRPLPIAAEQEIAQGNLTTDNEGKFVLEFTALEDKSMNRYNPIYQYNIMVDVTDINGETHSQTSYVSVGKKSMLINIDFPESILQGKENYTLHIATTNLNGQPQASSLNCDIVQLEVPQRYLHPKPKVSPPVILKEKQKMENDFPYLDVNNANDKSTWKIKKEKYHGIVDSKGEINVSIPDFKNYEEGHYKIIIKTKDIYGEEVEAEKYFFIFKENGKKCVAYEALWLYTDKNTAEVGDEVKVYIGSYLPKANIYVEVISNDTLLQAEWISVEQGMKTYTFKMKESYRGNITFNAFLCDQNKCYDLSQNIAIPFTNKMIDFEFITFRDKLQPGTKEEWKIKIKGKEGEKLSGELLLSMYDASLDAFKKNNFYLSLHYLNNMRHKRFYSIGLSSYFSNSYFLSLRKNMYQLINRNYYELMYTFSRDYYLYNSYAGGRRAKSAGYGQFVDEAAVMEADASPAAEMDDGIDYDNTASSVQAEDKANNEPSLPRTNFAETAFFYPQLQTDKEGNVVFSFTMPESLTKWKFQGIAHTKDLRTGSFEKFIQTQKELMIVPNAPRFLREGDTIVFSAKVVNMSERVLTGKVSLELFNAQNNEKLMIIPSYKNQTFTTAKGMSQEVNFTLVVPMGLGAISYRIMATTDVIQENNAKITFSDGEEKILPVMPNRMLVTETLSLPVKGEETKTFTFKEMNNNSTTLTHYKYTLEFTSNPVWYAIQSLPYMMEYPYECNEQIFSRMYANSIATHIANMSPKIQEVFESWKNLTPDAFCSNLEKNQELKSLVLEETPWVMDAQNESANKQRVGLLFDIQRMARENNAAIDKLEKNQLYDGSWPWFAGGRGSRYITQHIVCGFGHLQNLGIDFDVKANTLRKAIDYLDKEITKDYDELKKYAKLDENYVGYTNIHYLYARSFHLKNYPLSPIYKEAYNFFLNQSKKSWKSLSVYMQAYTALTLYRNGEVELAETIMQAIKKRAQYSDEMGMYWKKEGYGYYWHEAPIERQALLIEAFQEILKDEISVDKMKIWLLKQKQTQSWETTKSTALACYALLINNQQLLAEEKDAVVINVGKHILKTSEIPNAEAGTGYFKTSWQADEISNDMASITVKKPSKGIAWGGVYWQYFENLDKIVQNKDIPHPLSLRKSLYKVTLNDRGEVLTAITEQQNLKVGDKVRIRIELRVDRDMEYIHLKDMRAASFEPINVISSYKHQDGLFYYESTRDASTNFFFDYLPKGTYVFEYSVIATQAGSFSNGISSVQCMYAPEFSEHSEGIRVIVR